MHVIWNLLRAELSAHAATLCSFVVVAAIISTANLVMGGATPAIAVCVLTVAFLPSALFAQDERAHLDTMYSVLPVTRAQFVVARYLFVALIVAAATLVGLIAARVDDAVRALELTLTAEEVAYLEETYVPHELVGPLARPGE